MRLEKITLNGFKSFADKTEFNFDRSITAIVGPNGCGKSNVVDAVKWVLGEQSVKSLRSGHMADVIFSGSSTRKAQGTAEVSLLISNTTGTLPIEADQVEITRRIYKSGESEYLINNSTCRLRDIKELFMDTGVGTRAYSIIEQGQIEQLLNASKSDRRVIFEEAAGVSKYKAHKKEALRKLDRTEQNLLRLADILGEVEKQLRSIKYQAGKARNYLKYTERLKELQVNYSLVEYAKNDKLNTEKTKALETLEHDFAVTSAEVAEKDALMSNMGKQIIDTENQINHTDNNLVSVQSKIEQLIQRIEFLNSRMTELSQRKQDATDRVEKLQENENIFAKDVERYRDEQSKCEQIHKEKISAIEQLKEDIQRINNECTSLEADLRDEKSGIIDIVRRTAQLHNELQSTSEYRDNLANQKDRLEGRADTARVELEKLLTEKAEHQARSEDIAKVLDELEQNLESKRAETELLEKAIEAENKRLSNSKEARSALSGELTILTDMENRREGLNDAVKNILEKRSVGTFDYVEGLLADIVSADVKYANAVEASLQGRTDALVVTSSETLLADLEAIEKLDGRISFICTDKTGPFADSCDLSNFSQIKGRLVEFVNYDSKYAPLMWQLLGKTLVVENINDAANLKHKLGDQYQFVTLKGQLLNSQGMIKLGPLGKASGLISRKSRLRQLQETIGKISTEITAIDEQTEQNYQKKEHLAKLCKELRTAVYEANTEKMAVGSKQAVFEQEIKRLSEEQPLISGEIEMLEQQIAQSVQKEYNSKQKLEELESVNQQRTQRIGELEQQFAEQKTLQQSQSEQLTELKVIIGQIEEQRKALKNTLESLANQISSNKAAIETAKAESKSCCEQIDESQRSVLDCESKVSELYMNKEEVQQSSIKLHDQIKQLLENQEQTELLLKEKRSKQEQVNQNMNQLKIELGQLQVKQQDLTERVREELNLDLAEAFKNYQEQDVDWSEIKEEITELRDKIDRLGNVNLDAINEQESLDQRQQFLSTQVEDLNKSKGQLQQLINRLNKKSRDKFAETFEQIRLNFQQIFRKLFGGGKADIVLEDTEDILEAGIEIIARPPGKETRSISLLSGGEKSMTAMALLFSVFKSKPSPFCFLDEVDAALDEANNERFNMLIREFQKDSQFIIITHAKRTMSIADMLYGVTMQTRGVSKKISVQFGQYDPEEETAAVA